MRRVTPRLQLIEGLGRRSASALEKHRRELRPLLPDIARLLREEAMLDRELAVRVRALDAGARTRGTQHQRRQLRKLREHCSIRCTTLLNMTQHPRRKGGGSDDMLTVIPALDAPEITARIELRGWLTGLSVAYARAERRANEAEDTVLALRFCSLWALVKEDIADLAKSNRKEKRA